MHRKMLTEHVQVIAFNADNQWPLAKWLGQLQKAVEAIPAEHRDTAIVKTGDSEGSFVALAIEYTVTRLETDSEAHSRAYSEACAAQARDRQERAEYERLKAKYGLPEELGHAYDLAEARNGTGA